MATEIKADLREDMDKIREDLQSLRDDLTKATGSLYEASRESMSAAGQQAREGADLAKQYMQETVTEKPMTSLLVAAGVGVLIGALFHRQ